MMDTSLSHDPPRGLGAGREGGTRARRALRACTARPTRPARTRQPHVNMHVHVGMHIIMSMLLAQVAQEGRARRSRPTRIPTHVRALQQVRPLAPVQPRSRARAPLSPPIAPPHTHPCTVSEWLQREHCERQNPRGWCLRHRTPHRAIAASTRRALLMRHFERFEQKCLRGNRPRWVAFRRPRKLRSASRARCATSVHAKRTSTRSLPCRS